VQKRQWDGIGIDKLTHFTASYDHDMYEQKQRNVDGESGMMLLDAERSRR